MLGKERLDVHHRARDHDAALIREAGEKPSERVRRELIDVCRNDAPRALFALFGALETAGFAFDVELLLRAQARGYRIVEVPVNWAERQGSKVGVVFNGPGMLLQLLRARWRVGWR